MKDPAFLVYYQDFIVGTMYLSDEELGAYWRLLLHQADRFPDHFSEEDMKIICKTYVASFPAIRSKFDVDAEGKFYNKRLELEIEKRASYCESRRKNRKHMNIICKSYVKHMEDGNENTSSISSEGGAGETWRTSFTVYEKEVGDAYDALLADAAWMAERKEFHPRLNVEETLRKSFNDFWGVEAGWRHKKKSRAKDLDWKATFANALTMRCNQVWAVAPR